MNLLDKYVIEKYAKSCAARAGMGVHFDAAAPYAEDKNIHLPPITDKTSDVSVTNMLHFVAHEVGHVLWSDFSVLKAKKPSEVLKSIWNCLEDHRIDYLTAIKYDGDKATCDELHTTLYPRVEPKLKERLPVEHEAFVWSQVIRCDYSPMLSTVVVPYAGDLEKYTARLREVRAIEDAHEGTTATYDLALAILNDLDEEQEGEGGGEGAEGDASDGEASSSESYSEITGTTDDAAEPKKGESSAEYMDDLARSGEYIPATLDQIEVVTFSGTTPTSSVGRRIAHDYFESSLNALNAHLNNGFVNKVRSLLQILSRVRKTYAQKKGKLHGRSLHRLSVKDGGGYSERVFTNKTEALSLDVSVALLVDYSGSMSCSDRIVHAMKSASMLSDVLGNVLNIPTAVYGFSSYRTSGDEYLSVAEFRKFTDKWVSDETMQKRMLSYCCSMNNNADGEAINYVYNKLRDEKSKRKILIVLSDGEPCASPPHRGSVTKYTTNVCKAIYARRDVEMFGIGIQTSAVKHFYKEHVVLENVDSLEPTLINALQTLLINRK